MSVWKKIQSFFQSYFGVKQPSKIWAKESEKIVDLIQQGVEEGMEDPLFWFDEDGNVHRREFTKEEMAAAIYVLMIVERAFPGIYSELEE